MGLDTPFTLCDPVRARRWVRQAAEIGRPFRVALPTYGYTLAFDRAGKFLSLAAEGPRPACRPATLDAHRAGRRRRAGGAGARELTSGAAAGALHGLAPGFRQPVAGDRLNWDPLTLATVLRGRCR